MICPNCAEKVSALSNRCPHCTSEYGHGGLWKFNLQIFMWVVIFIIVLAAFFS